MKNKKGFTLIELLAVIVILAIIALIAIPIVLNMIENARKKAAESSAYGYVEAIEYNNGLSDMNDDYDFSYEKVTGDKNVSEINVKMKGKKPDSGSLSIDESGKVTNAELCISGYKVIYESPKVISVKKDNNCKTNSSGSNETAQTPVDDFDNTKPTAETCFVFDSSTKTITGFNSSNSCKGDIVIPSSINGVDVENIGENAFKDTTITGLVFANDTKIKTIGMGAFSGVPLEKLVLPKTITSIYPTAFAGVEPTLKKIKIGLTHTDNIVSGQYSIYSSNGIGYTFNKGSLSNVEKLEVTDVETIGPWYSLNSLFPNLTEVKLNEGLTEISNVTFNGLTKLSKINIPSTVTKIGNQAFNNTSINNMTIPSSITTWDYAFEDNKNIEKVVISEGITNIGKQTFDGCENLKTVVVPKTIKSIGSLAFIDSKIESINLPEGLETIGIRAFANSSLKKVTIPSSVTSWNSAFLDANELTEATISNGITEIPSQAFGDAVKLENVSIPNTVTSIKESAFGGTSLKNVNIPASVSEIEGAAFYTKTAIDRVEVSSKDAIALLHGRTNGINKLVIKSGVTEIANETSYTELQMSIDTIYVPKSVTKIGKGVFSKIPITKICYAGTEAEYDAVEVDETYNLNSVWTGKTKTEYNCSEN